MPPIHRINENTLFRISHVERIINEALQAETYNDALENFKVADMLASLLASREEVRELKEDKNVMAIVTSFQSSDDCE